MQKQYLKTRHGSVLRHVSKVNKMGFEMGVHHFEIRKFDLTKNPIGSYISIDDQEFLIRYNGQIETCHICYKPGHKSVECDKKFDKQWPELSDDISNVKLERMPKFLRNRRSCRKNKTKKM